MLSANEIKHFCDGSHESQFVCRPIMFLQRKYVNKIENRWTCRCTTKQLGLLTTGRDIRLLTKKRTVLTL